MSSNMSATNGKRMGAPAIKPGRTTAVGKARRFALGALAMAIAFAFACAGALWPEGAANADEPAVVHVSYQWYSSETGMTEDYEVLDVGADISGGLLTATVMPEAYDLGDGCSWRVMKNFAGGLPAGETEITDEVSYDEATGTLSLPASRSGEHITAVFCMPWDHISHASHGHFPTTATRAILGRMDNQLKAMGAPVLRASGSAPEVGKTYYLSVESGETGRWSSPVIYGADSDNEGAGAVFGYPEFEGRYKFYVAFERGNCELFELADAIPGRQGVGGTIYGSTGTPYNTDWAADYQWCSADCVEAVYNTGGDPVPLAGDGSWVRVDSMSEGALNCTFRIQCDNPDGSNAQDIMGTFELPYNPNGAIALQKASANPAVSAANGCYSLEGAVFGVFATEEDARTLDASRAIATFSTDENGAWKSGEDFKADETYYVAEIEAPEGYALNGDVLPVVVKAGETVSLTLEDAPLLGSGDFAVHKVDSSTGLPEPQGNASLSGAEVEFRYYDGYYTASDLPGTPLRTWVMRTGDDGIASLLGGESSRVRGDAFFQDAAGSIALPLGTVTAIETKAPSGYLLGTPKTYVAHVRLDPATNSVTVVPVNYGGEEATEGNAPVIREVIATGTGEVRKTDSTLGSSAAQGDASLAGAVFEVVNASKHPVTIDGRTCAAGEVAMEIVTNADGVASTGKILPFGTYTVREKEAPSGYLANEELGEEMTISSDGDTKTVSVSDEVARGSFSLCKYSRHLERTGPAGDASLAGARFEVFNESNGPVVVNGSTYAKGAIVAVVETDGDGNASTADRALPYGTYRVREASTSEAGYLFDDESRSWSTTFSIREDGQHVECGDKEASVSNDEMRGNIALSKADAETGKNEGQGDASLAGAVYEIVNRSAAAVMSPQSGAEVEPGGVVCTIVTDDVGNASTDNADANGWTMPADFGGKALMYGTYEVREQGAAEGYLVNEAFTQTVSVRADGQVLRIATDDGVQRGRLVVGKVSRENASHIEQGAASLEGWSFEIVNESERAVVVDGALHAPGEVVKTITTQNVDGVYVADTGERALPFGTYEVHEIQTTRPQECGYLFDGESEAWSKTFAIRADGETVDYSASPDACANQVVRGDLSLAKAESPSMKRLAGIPFKITSATTGEWHVLVTDANGMASTESDMSPRSGNVNASDAALSPEGTVDESKLDPEAGIWFDGSTAAPTSPHDSKGALPFDTYLIEELPVKANAGLNLVSVEVTVTRDGRVIDLGTIDDVKGVEPQVSTSLNDAEGGKLVAASPSATLVDTVTYNNLDTTAGYRLCGTLVTVSDGEVTGEIASAELEFSPATTHGTVQLPFEGVDTTALEGCTLVCFERLYDSSGTQIAEHADPADEGQTVSVPAIATTLVDAASGDHVASCEGESVELTDTVAYTGLVPHRTYTMNGQLYDKETGNTVLDSNGAPITASTSFTPDSPEGTVSLTFAFNVANMRGTSIVAFESLSQRGVEYAVHADIDDEDQTVAVPLIGTTLVNASTGGHVIPCEGTVRLADTVSFENLVPGRTYTAMATLYDRATGEPVMVAEGEEEPGDEDGVDMHPLHAAVEFAPESPSGETVVEFEVDASTLPETTVCFERVTDSSGRTMAVHEDIGDEGQAVTKPSIGTTLLDADSQTHVPAATGTITLVDVVTYKGLEPGKQYTAHGALHFQDTGEAVTDDAGTPIEAQAEFTPESPDGSVEVAFSFEGAPLAGKIVVAFESVESGGQVYATHADLEDTGQCAFIPAIRTTLIDTGTGGHTASGTGPCKLVDTVTYEGLEANAAYTVEGTLMDAATGNPVLQDGQPVTAITQFTPAGTSGTVQVTFEVADVVSGGSFVAFERLLDAGGRMVASHEDLSDQGQTVDFPAIGTTLLDAASGTHLAADTGEWRLVDTVAYKNLTVGKTYTVTGSLHIKDTGATVTDADGVAVTATADFTPDKRDGTVDVEFAFKQPSLAGEAVVAFERVEADGVEYAVHADLEDEDQTVRIPRIGTTLVDATTGTHASLAGEAYSLVDTVTYQGLVPGETYTVEGRLVDVATGEPVKDVNGNPVCAKSTFTPANPEGETDVAFSFSADVAGTSIVAFESLLDATGRVVCMHEDLGDAGQTITVPLIRTTLSDKKTGGDMVHAAGTYHLVDDIAYEGLQAGVVHLAEGRLVDASTGEPVKDSSGEDVVASTLFMPLEANGTTSVEFSFETEYAGCDLVAYEQVHADGKLIAEHADIDDEAQTVHIPRISTTAIDAGNGKHEAGAADSATIIDEVRYDGLEPGRTYRIHGTLMDKTTGQPVLNAGSGVTATRDFKADRSSSSEQLRFSVSGQQLDGKSFVVFEDVYLVEDDGTEVHVGSHSDIDDAGQTVSYHAPTVKDLFDKTGYWLLQQWRILAFIAVALTLVGGIMRRKGAWPWRKQHTVRGTHAARR